MSKKDSSAVLLQILPSLRSGGVERGTLEIAKAAADAGFTSLVASSGGPMVAALEATGAKHITLPLASKNPFRIYINSFRLGKIIREYDVDIIHARSRAPAWSGWLAARRYRCHFVTTFHGTYDRQNRIKRWYNSIMTRGDKVIAISQFIANHIEAFYRTPKERLTVIHRGVDIDHFNPEAVEQDDVRKVLTQWKPQKDKPIILLPGRLTRWKGQDFLLEALHLIPHQDFTCILMGDRKAHREYQKELQEKIEQYRLRGHVTILGHNADIAACYKAADIIISASIRPEAFGRVAVEAQAMQKIVIATRHGGSMETVLDKKTGFLVSPTDPKELADAIMKVLDMKATDREKMGRHARQFIIENFSTRRMCEQTIGLYQSL